METDPPRKTRAIVFSDIQGYSRLMSRDEGLALRLLEEHNGICVPLVKSGRGTVLKFLGDAILSSFESASDAVACGIAIQKALAARNASRPDDERIVVRIGIHIGDVVFKDGDVFGDGVNIAARIEPLAEPGGIAISQTVYDMVKARPEIQTVSLGPKELKNIKEAVTIYKVLLEAQEGGSVSSGPRRGLLLAAVAAAALLAAGGVAVKSRSAPRPATAAPPAPSRSFAGVWETTFGRMTLTASGSSVRGTYDMGGAVNRLEGRQDGSVLTFAYHEPSLSGEGLFRLSADGGSFEGEWRQSGETEAHTWTGRRVAP